MLPTAMKHFIQKKVTMPDVSVTLKRAIVSAACWCGAQFGSYTSPVWRYRQRHRTLQTGSQDCRSRRHRYDRHAEVKEQYPHTLPRAPTVMVVLAVAQLKQPPLFFTFLGWLSQHQQNLSRLLLTKLGWSQTPFHPTEGLHSTVSSSALP